MEEIKDRLSLLSESPVTDSLSILSTLNPLVEELFSSPGPSSAKQITDLLTTSLGHSNPVLSSTLIEILSRWRTSSEETPSVFIQELLYQLPRVSYPGTLVSAIGRLQPANASSTYLAILRHCPTSWPWVLDQIQRSDFESVAPLFAQVLLDPSPSIHLTSFRLALREHLLQKKEAKSQFFISKSLQWLNPSPENHVWIFEIIKSLSPEERLAMYASLTIDKVTRGMDPSQLLTKIKEELKTLQGSGELILSSVILMLTKAFDRAFFGHYLSFLEVFKDLFALVKDKSVLGIFVCSLLGVTLVPSKLLPQELWKISSTLINRYYEAISTTKNKEPSKILQWNKDVNLSCIQIELLQHLSSSKKATIQWLKQDSEPTLDHLYIVKTLFLGCEDDSVEVLEASVKVLSKILTAYPQRSQGVLAILLHKLSKERRPNALNVILKSLSIVVKDRNCIKFVVKIVNSLSNSGHLGALKLKLLFDLYEIEDRTYPVLHKALEEKYSSDEGNIAKAYIIYKICSKKSSKHASDLLPLLSEILNSSGHEYASLLALKALYAMCSDSVIDVETTLKAIQPKIMADGHVDVRISLLDICSLLPDFEVSSEKYETFSIQTLKFIWSCTKKCEENPPALRRAAFKSIGKYGLYKQRFEFLPLSLTDGFNPVTLVENEVTISYVPGECWVRALAQSSEEDLPLYKDLLQDFLRDEIKELPPSVYYLPHKNNEKTRMDYSEVLSETSVLRYLLSTLQSGLNTHTPSLVNALFQILSSDYPQQFPPLNWDFLNASPKKYSNEIITLLSNQVRKSNVARLQLDKIMDSKEQSPENVVGIMSKLDVLLQHHNTPILKSFLDRTADSLIDKTPLKCLLGILRDKAGVCMRYEEFNSFFKALYENVSCDEELLDLYLEVVPFLPHEYWSQFSNPLLQSKVTQPLLNTALKTRRILSLNDNCSLIWFNDVIESLTLDSSTFHAPSIHASLLQSFNEARRNDESNRRWISDFMGLILSIVRRRKKTPLVLFDIFVEALAVFSGLSSHLTSPIMAIGNSSNKPGDFLSPSIQLCLTSEAKAWNSFGIPLGEWLLSLLRDERIPEELKCCIRSSLSSFKYGSDFDQICIKLVGSFYQFK